MLLTCKLTNSTYSPTGLLDRKISLALNRDEFLKEVVVLDSAGGAGQAAAAAGARMKQQPQPHHLLHHHHLHHQHQHHLSRQHQGLGLEVMDSPIGTCMVLIAAAAAA